MFCSSKSASWQQHLCSFSLVRLGRHQTMPKHGREGGEKGEGLGITERRDGMYRRVWMRGRGMRSPENRA